jgi:hypothetical protein
VTARVWSRVGVAVLACMWSGWVLVIAFFVFVHLQQPVEEEILQLQASNHPSAELPVYAQFFVSQTARLAEPRRVDRLTVPVVQYAATPTTLHVIVSADGSFREQHDVPITPTTKAVGVQLRNTRPAREYTVLLSAREIPTPEGAPRVYREKSVSGYRDGQLSIAGVTKEGNISLFLSGRESRAVLEWRGIAREPWRASSWISLSVFAALLAVAPAVVLHLRF